MFVMGHQSIRCNPAVTPHTVKQKKVPHLAQEVSIDHQKLDHKNHSIPTASSQWKLVGRPNLNLQLQSLHWQLRVSRVLQLAFLWTIEAGIASTAHIVHILTVQHPTDLPVMCKNQFQGSPAVRIFARDIPNSNHRQDAWEFIPVEITCFVVSASINPTQAHRSQ